MDYIKEVEVKYRKRKAVGLEGGEIKKPSDVYDLFRLMADDTVEKFYVLYLNIQHIVQCFRLITVGRIDRADPPIAEVIRTALLTCTPHIILVHNHPSGEIRPSEEDRNYTDKVKEAGRLLDIKVLDHIIIGDGVPGYYSFNEAGKL